MPYLAITILLRISTYKSSTETIPRINDNLLKSLSKGRAISDPAFPIIF